MKARPIAAIVTKPCASDGNVLRGNDNSLGLDGICHRGLPVFWGRLRIASPQARPSTTTLRLAVHRGDTRSRQGSLDAHRRQEYLDAIATGLTLEQLSAPIEADAAAGVLDRLGAAAATANELRGLGDELLDRYVQAARAEGRSWAEIGTALGVTKQAAHERFVDAPLAWPQNFNEPARAVVARALEEARGFGHRYLGTEHLLLALSAERGLASTALTELGVAERAVRDSIERIIGRGRSGDSATLGITPRTKRVLEAAVKEAKQVGRQRCADPEHLLLALAASDGVARDILAERGVGEEAVRERLASLIEREAPEIAAMVRAAKRRGVRRRWGA